MCNVAVDGTPALVTPLSDYRKMVAVGNQFYSDVLGRIAWMVWRADDGRARIFFEDCPYARKLNNKATTLDAELFAINAKHAYTSLGNRRVAWVLAALVAESQQPLRVQYNTKGLQVRIIVSDRDEAIDWFKYMASILL